MNDGYVKQSKNHRKSMEGLFDASLTQEQWEYCKQYFNDTCAYCRKKPKVLCRDHVIPLSSGGTLSADNIVPCCSSCNSSKSSRDFIKWYRRAPFYSNLAEKKIVEYLKAMKEKTIKNR